MSDDDIAVVLSNSAAFSAQDVDAMLRHYSEDAEVVDRRRVGFGSFTGHEELRSYYSGITTSALEMHESLEVVASRDGLVAAQCELRGRLVSDPTGPEVSAPYGLLIALRDGLITRLDLCEDGEHAMELGGFSS